LRKWNADADKYKKEIPAQKGGKHFIFVVNDIRKEGHFLPAREVYDKLMRTGIWGINERTPNRRELLTGTKIVFYQAGKEGQKVLLETAEISKNIYPLSEEEIVKRKLQSVYSMENMSSS